MGTHTLGNTAIGVSSQYWFQDTANGVAIRSQDNLTAPAGDMYIDKIHVFGNSEGGSSNANARGAIYNTSNALVSQSNTFTLGTSTAYYTASWSAGSLVHIAAGAQFRGAILVPGGGGLRTWGRNDSGTFNYIKPISSFPSTFSGTNQGGLGNWPWYVEYFPGATITSIPSTPQFPGATIDVYGQSFTAGVSSVTLNGVACSGVTVVSDSHLTCVLPSNATTGPVQVVTNAGTATSAGNLVVSGGRVYNGGTLKSTTAVRVYNGGTLKPVTRIRVYNGGTLKDAH